MEIKKYKEQSNKENHNHWNGNLISLCLDSDNDDVSNTKEENIIPMWDEEIIVNKTVVKLGEIDVRKHEINITQKIDVEVKTEKLTAKYPDNRREEIF